MKKSLVALAALFVLTGKSEYQDAMKEGIEEYTHQTNKQEMSEKQKENFLTSEELRELFDGPTLCFPTCSRMNGGDRAW